MVVLRWCTMALVALLVFALPPAQATYPECRDVTEGVPSEYYNDRYVYIEEDHIQEWREFNGYTGLQRQKCVTETGVVLGRDTLMFVVYYDDPTNPVGPGAPELPETPDPGNPFPDLPPELPWTVCDREPGTPLAQIVAGCLQDGPEIPDGPNVDPPHGVCGAPATTPLTGQLWYCVPPIYTDPDAIVAYIDWIQFVLGATIDLVLYLTTVV